jgi:hypothetical protein
MPYDVASGTYTYNIGDLLRIRATFTDIAGAVADPTNVTLKVKAPSGTITTYTYPGTVSKESNGIYYYDFPVTASGVHFYNWAGTGAYTAADESQFSVVTTQF